MMCTASLHMLSLSDRNALGLAQHECVNNCAPWLYGLPELARNHVSLDPSLSILGKPFEDCTCISDGDCATLAQAGYQLLLVVWIDLAIHLEKQ